MFNVGPLELGVILLIVILLFGPKRLPELGSGIGKAISNFKKAFRESETSDEDKKPENKA